MVNFFLHTEAVCLISFTGAEVFLSSLLQRLESDISMTLSALHCLKVEPFLRKRIAESLIPSSKLKANVSFQRGFHVVANLMMQDLLYVILIARNRVVTLIRPRKHSIHPAGPLSLQSVFSILTTPILRYTHYHEHHYLSVGLQFASLGFVDSNLSSEIQPFWVSQHVHHLFEERGTSTFSRCPAI